MNAKKIQVLLVEDNPGDVRMVREMMSEISDLEIHDVDNLAACIAQLNARTRDVLLLDLGLPDSQGLGTLRTVLGMGTAIPVVVLTGHDDEALGRAAVQEGAQDYLVKGRVAEQALARAIRYAIERKQIEQTLRETEERYRNLLDAAPVGIAVHSDGKIVFTNPAGARLLGGESEEQIIGRSVFDIIHPDGLMVSKSRIQRMLAGEQGLYPAEDTYRKLDGTLVNVEVMATALNFNGKPSVQVIITDITERKRTEAALSESEGIFKAFLEHSPIYVFFKDENMRTVRLSRNFETMLGRPMAELLGKDMNELFASELAKNMIADDLKILKEGREIVVEEELNGRFYTTIKFPIHLKGKPSYLAGFTIDITERKRMEEMLRKSEEKFRRFFESSQDAIMILEPPSWRFTIGNPAAVKLFGAKNESDFVSHTPEELSPDRQPDGRMSTEKSREMIETAKREGSNLFEWRHKRINGEEFPADVLLTRMEKNGEAILQATVRDISERERTDKEIKNKLYELQCWYSVTVDREERIIELKQEVNDLLKKAGEQARYAGDDD